MRPRLLDLFCGAGGAAMGYHRAGFDVVGVDIAPQPNYPFEFHQLDAMALRQDALNGCWHESPALTTLPGRSALCLGKFDAVHLSPPCQRFCTMTGDARGNHPDLVEGARNIARESGLPYVIENVPQAPLINPVTLCGSAFGLRVRRHRGFESNVPIVGTEHHHAEQGRPVGVYGQHPDRKQHLRPDGTQRGTKATSAEHAGRAMGIWWMDWPELAESIPPAYTEHVGRQLLHHIETMPLTREDHS